MPNQKSLFDIMNNQPVTEVDNISGENRAYEAGFYDGMMSAEDEPPKGILAYRGWRDVYGMKGRDFTEISRAELSDLVFKLSMKNPIAKRVLEIKRDFTLGRGSEVNTEDERLQAVFDDFVRENELNVNLFKFIYQLRLFGEQLFPVFVRKTDGQVNLGYFDPKEIEQNGVICHPQNAMQHWIILRKGSDIMERSAYRIVRRERSYTDNGRVVNPPHIGRLVTHEQAAIRPWELEILKQFGIKEYSGSIIYWSINNVSNQGRGFSDLLPLVDWLGALDNALWALVNREEFAAYFSWLVKIENGDKEAVNRRRREVQRNPPAPGSVMFYTGEEWSLAAPPAGQSGTIAAAETVLKFIAGGVGIPLHWLGDGGDTNRATAAEQNSPTWKSMQSQQDYTLNLLEFMFEFVRDQAIISGQKFDDESFKIVMPEMTSKDLQATVQPLQQLAAALNVVLNDLKLVDREVAAKAVSKVFHEFGIEYDWRKILAGVGDEDTEKTQGKPDKADVDKTIESYGY